MADPIGQALDAATAAMCALPMSAEHREEAATAIAAFLHALPPEFRAPVHHASGNVDEALFCEDWPALAAAIEQDRGHER